MLVQSTVLTHQREALNNLGPTAQALVSAPVYGASIEQDPYGWQTVPTGSVHEAPIGASTVEARLAQVLPAGDRVVPVRLTQAALAGPAGRYDGDVQSVPAADLPAVATSTLVDGAWPREPGEVSLPDALADDLGVRVGDELPLRVKAGDLGSFTVTGITNGPMSSTGTTADVLTVDESFDEPGRSTAWFVVGDEPVDWETVGELNRDGIAVSSRAVVLDPPPTPAAVAEVDDPIPAGTLAVVAAAITMGLLEVVLLVGPAFAVGARRAQRQLAVIAAAGGERRTLRQVVLLGGVVIGSVAAVGGAVLGVVGAVVDPGGRGRSRVDRLPRRCASRGWSIGGFVVLGVLVAVAAVVAPRAEGRSGRRRGGARGPPCRGAAASACPTGRARLPRPGLAAAFVGAAQGTRTVVVAGVVLIQVGVIAASGGLITLVGRLAPRAGVSARLAMRDAARQRGRTAPAVAAVIAAMAGVVAAGVYMDSRTADDAAHYNPLAAVGRTLVSFGAFDQWGDPVQPPDAAAARQIERAAGLALSATGTAEVDLGRPAAPGVAVVAQIPAERSCILPGDHVDPTCLEEGSYSLVFGGGGMSSDNVLVDDGTTVAALGLPDAAAAAAALRSGKVLVDERAVWPDGTAHLSITEEGSDATSDPAPVVVPAAPVERLGQFDIVLTPDVAERMGVQSIPMGFVVTAAATPTTADEVAARTAVAGDGAGIYVERGYGGRAPPMLLWVLVLAALVVGLGATGLAMALAAAEFRPDLATLAAVGASPRVRRRVAAAQSGVVVAARSRAGVRSGLVLGWVLVLAASRLADGRAVRPWSPWSRGSRWVAIAVGVPLLAIGGAYLLTRSRLPVTPPPRHLTAPPSPSRAPSTASAVRLADDGRLGHRVDGVGTGRQPRRRVPGVDTR